MSPARRFFDVRPSERVLVGLSIAYLATVVASFLLAKPIRNALFLRQYGAYRLVYVYAGVTLALSVLAPLYELASARFGPRRVVPASLAVFALNVVGFWAAFRFSHPPGLTAAF